MKCVIPVSGGLDSTVMIYDAAKSKRYDEIYAITFFYNQRHAKKEIDAAFALVENLQEQTACQIFHEVVDLSFFSDIATSSSLTNENIDVAKTKDVLGDPQTVNYVPFRNLMMLSILCSYAESNGAQEVYYGSALVDSQAGYWDGSEEFFSSLNNIVGLNRKNKITIRTPLITLDKKDIIQLGIRSEVPFEDTWTCYEGNELSCGHCPACSSRIKGFLDNNMKDPLVYNRNINWPVEEKNI